jgi:outer membrane lipoprotein SlyB
MRKLNVRRVGAEACLWVAIMMLVGCEAAPSARSTGPTHSTITYGRITAVDRVTLENAGAQTAGALVGGSLGMLSGSGQSSSNQALRGVGGAFAGQQLARAMSNEQGFRYTILSNGRSFTVVTDGASLRVGDCVSVERGQFNNIRLAPDSSCPASGAAATPSRAAVSEADACNAAKDQLLVANDQAAFDLAERRVRLLCND